jgi:AcrR family transcriptional regulator
MNEPMTTRDRLIQSAHDQFYRLGFHAVGLDAILKEAGVTKTTFYKYFESKDDLMHHVLHRHDRWWQDTFRQLLRQHGGDTAQGQLLGAFDALHGMLSSDDFNGCFFVSVAVHFPLQHDPAHEAAAEHKRAMERIIRELAGYAGAADPVSFAQEFSLVLEGAYVTQQVTGSPKTTEIARRVGRLIIEKHLAKPQIA